MALDVNGGSPGSFYDGCIRTYGAATRLMSEVWEDVVGEPMETLSGSPKIRFREALRHFERRIARGGAPTLDGDLRKAAASDEVLHSLIVGGLDKPEAELSVDVDDVPPSVFKEAIRDEAEARAEGDTVDVDLDDFLRAVVARVVESMSWERRFNVGENRHFPRMVQWLREIEDETTWDGGTGLRLMNRSGAGSVAARPSSPYTLKVRINADWL